MAAASGEVQYISIKMFDKTSSTAFDYDANEHIPYGMATLEHLFWHLFFDKITPTTTATTLRKKIRSSKTAQEKAIRNWEENDILRNEFIEAWKTQIEMDEKMLSKMKFWATMTPNPNFHYIIPKNKSLYREWAYNPEIDGCRNRLGESISTILASYMKEKLPVTTPDKDSEEMMRHTFCPDCESLLFIGDKKDGKLFKHCSVCGWNRDMTQEEITKPIYSSSKSQISFQFSDHDVDEIIQDPTLPRINNIPCVNHLCPTNHFIDEKWGFLVNHMSDKDKMARIIEASNTETLGDDGIVIFDDTKDALLDRIKAFGLKEEDGILDQGPMKRTVLYYRTNPDALSFSYICTTCKTIWSNT